MEKGPGQDDQHKLYRSVSTANAQAANEARPLLIQKFGGTSLGTHERLQGVCDIIKNSAQDHRVAVVVSAVSPQDKARGTTSLLLRVAEAAMAGDLQLQDELMTQIETTHHDIIKDLIKDVTCRFEATEHVYKELKKLSGFLDALRVIQELSPRSHDMVIGVGERLSAGLLAAALRSNGVKAQYFDLSNLCKEAINSREPGYHHKIQSAMREALGGRINGCVPVITGFVGNYEGGIVEAVGRGYSDLTAALAAAEFEALELQVWKEVQGIFSADPKRVPGARVLPTVTPVEAAELTYFGSEVLHPFTMNVAISRGVPIRIKNTFDPESPGTAVYPDSMLNDEAPVWGAKAVTSKKKIWVLAVTSNQLYSSGQFLEETFGVLRRHRIISDLVSTSEVMISVAVNEATGPEAVYAAVEELGRFANASVQEDRAILSIIGRDIKGRKGVAARMFTCLAEAGVNIEMITQGASEVNVSCVIDENQVHEAMEVVHKGLCIP